MVMSTEYQCLEGLGSDVEGGEVCGYEYLCLKGLIPDVQAGQVGTVHRLVGEHVAQKLAVQARQLDNLRFQHFAACIIFICKYVIYIYKRDVYLLSGKSCLTLLNKLHTQTLYM